MAITGEIKKPGDHVDVSYSGGVQQYVIPFSGLYKLEVWGGACTVSPISYGGYSYGHIFLTKGTILYIVIGGNGTKVSKDGATAGGYNGGGNGYADRIYGGNNSATTGAGATHIATMTGTIVELRNKKEDSRVLIVAGGSGGSGPSGYNYSGEAGYGGGTTGNVGNYGNNGQGQNASDLAANDARDTGAGGGGGWIGGRASIASTDQTVMNHGPGAGGSGYVGNIPTIEFKGISYESKTISGNQSGFNKSDNGKAIITLIGKSAPSLYVGDKEAASVYIGTNEIADMFVGDRAVS